MNRYSNNLEFMDIRWLILGVLLCVLAVILFIILRSLISHNKRGKKYLPLLVLFLVSGLIGPLILLRVGMEASDVFTAVLYLLGSLGVSSIGFLAVIKIFICKTKIMAVYKGRESCITTRGGARYSPQFSYKFQGKRYIESSSEMFSARKLDKLFARGKQYEIYINEKKPNSLLIRRGLQISDLLLIMVGGINVFFALKVLIKIINF